MVNEWGEGLEWSVKKWTKMLDTRVKQNGLVKCLAGINGKPLLKWYKTKPKSMNER
jgi:hypothetical protein